MATVTSSILYALLQCDLALPLHQKLGYKSPSDEPQMAVLTCLSPIKCVEVMLEGLPRKGEKSLTDSSLAT